MPDPNKSLQDLLRRCRMNEPPACAFRPKGKATWVQIAAVWQRHSLGAARSGQFGSLSQLYVANAVLLDEFKK